MSSRAQVVAANQSLMDFADERGVRISRDTVGSLRGVIGEEAARDRIACAARLIDFAAVLGVELDYTSASHRLGYAGRDFDTAARRLREQVVSRDLAAFAERHGVRVDVSKLPGYACSRGENPHEWVRAVARVLDVASELGIPLEARGAWARVSNCGGDVDAAVAKLRALAESRRRRGSHYCRALGRGQSRTARVNAAAGCKCRGCVEHLTEELRRYTRWMIRFERPLPLKDDDDLQQEAGLALINALDHWDGTGDFTAYYGSILANHMASLNQWFATQGRGGERPLSLDAEVFTRHEGKRVELVETVPDRSMDTLKIVLIRESIAEYLAAADDAATRACVVYDTNEALV
jgi:hypothetical protein